MIYTFICVCLSFKKIRHDHSRKSLKSIKTFEKNYIRIMNKRRIFFMRIRARRTQGSRIRTNDIKVT